MPWEGTLSAIRASLPVPDIMTDMCLISTDPTPL